MSKTFFLGPKPCVKVSSRSAFQFPRKVSIHHSDISKQKKKAQILAYARIMAPGPILYRCTGCYGLREVNQETPHPQFHPKVLPVQCFLLCIALLFIIVLFAFVLLVLFCFGLVQFVFVLFIFVLLCFVWIQCDLFKLFTPSLVLLTLVPKTANVYVNSVITLMTTNQVHLIPK